MKFILVSHGKLAQSMLESAQMIVGEQQGAVAFGLHPQDDIGSLKNQIQQALADMAGEEIICFTDLFSGSPFNAVVSLMGEYPLQHLTGMNLPLILEAFMLRMNDGISREELCQKLVAQAPETFIDVNQYLEQKLIEEG